MDIESSYKVPFKNPKWLQKKKEQKAQKSSKQNKNLKQICLNEMQNTLRINYLHLDAPSSLKPPKKYCDITGFEVGHYDFLTIKTSYKEKSTGLFYADKHVFAYIRSLTKPVVEQYLALRKVTLPGTK